MWGWQVVPEGWSSSADPSDHFCPGTYSLPGSWSRLRSKHTAQPQRPAASAPSFPSCLAFPSSKGRRWDELCVWVVGSTFGNRWGCCLCGPCHLSQKRKCLRRSSTWEMGARPCLQSFYRVPVLSPSSPALLLTKIWSPSFSQKLHGFSKQALGHGRGWGRVGVDGLEVQVVTGQGQCRWQGGTHRKWDHSQSQCWFCCWCCRAAVPAVAGVATVCFPPACSCCLHHVRAACVPDLAALPVQWVTNFPEISFQHCSWA